MLNKSSQIAAVNAMDITNFRSVSDYLREIALLPDEIEKLYVMHMDAIRPFSYYS
jgi:hypothetical protein